MAAILKLNCKSQGASTRLLERYLLGARGLKVMALRGPQQDPLDKMIKTAGPRPIEKYLYLRALRSTQPLQYHQLMLKNPQDVLPYIYTPTVGQACQEYHTLGITTRGLYIKFDDSDSEGGQPAAAASVAAATAAGTPASATLERPLRKHRILDQLRAWPGGDKVRCIVVTDGERILGLGDLGANGMGISEGKIELYTAAAGVDPDTCLPVALDCGTNNAALLQDPAYKGRRVPRPPHDEYHAFVAEFMEAVKEWNPHVLVQFEDFGNTNAFDVLDNYKDTHCCFNDDIQGTASITLAALLASLRLVGGRLSEQRILFNGAGEAATGIAQLIALCMARREGLSIEEARKRCFLIDSKGLVTASRAAKGGLQHHKLPFAHEMADQPGIKAALEALRPTALIGVSAMAKAFDEEVIHDMETYSDHPIIFPLSNPTSLAECTFEQAFNWTHGHVLFASGSPFEPIEDCGGTTHYPAQANNAYIFPAVGYAAILTRARTVPEDVFLVAAECLAGLSSKQDLEAGRLFPPFSRIREVSAKIMAAAVRHYVDTGVGCVPEGWDPAGGGWEEAAAAAMWLPDDNNL